MTVIEKVKINHINYINEIKNAIINNDPIDNILHVIIAISNPCNYQRRYTLTKEFIERMSHEQNIILYVVELVYNNQNYKITNSNNPNHLQLKTDNVLWHKENLINCGVNKLLPSNWKAVAWIDADIEFESNTWAIDTLKILNGCRDIVQLFSHSIDLDQNKDAMRIFQSFGYQYNNNRQYSSSGLSYWHTGYAWACNRKAYDKSNGLFDLAILGSGDFHMCMSYLNRAEKSLNIENTEGYHSCVKKYQELVKNLRIGYVPGVIKHYFHGLKKNRKYTERWVILIDNKYDPNIHITKNEDGVIIPTNKCPQKLLDDILQYFKERNEDDFLYKK